MAFLFKNIIILVAEVRGSGSDGAAMGQSQTQPVRFPTQGMAALVLAARREVLQDFSGEEENFIGLIIWSDFFFWLLRQLIRSYK